MEMNISRSSHIKIGSSYSPPLPEKIHCGTTKDDRPGSLPGKHLILDLLGAENLTDPNYIGNLLSEAARDCNVVVINQFMHSFGDGMGVTGVIVLAESHISIHTWPEVGTACIDIFMCGKNDPRNCIPRIVNSLDPSSIKLSFIVRSAEI
ncbi:adenosylmethionine decarboxylase [Rhizobium aquaticum]|uniref:adenosylmethionine decarboxylase n=1 Tax=Rhizobium aquaticum TaxID=1549636 RepID=UPI0033926574